MEITWYGYSCFRITERGQSSVLTDPHTLEPDSPALGLRADVVTLSHEGADRQLEELRGGKYPVRGAGEYEIGELFITGVPLHQRHAEEGITQRNIAYHFEYPNGLSFLHLGVLRELPDQALTERFDELHALFLPIGGASLAGDRLAELLNMLEPRYVLPMHGADLEEADFEAALEAFLKASGASNLERQDSLRVSPSNPGEGTQAVCLRPAS